MDKKCFSNDQNEEQESEKQEEYSNSENDGTEKDDIVDDADLFGGEEDFEESKDWKIENQWHAEKNNFEENKEKRSEEERSEEERSEEEKSEEGSGRETRKAVEESYPIECAEIHEQIFPDDLKNDIHIIRFPPKIPFISTPFDEEKEMTSKTSSCVDAMRWRYFLDKKGEPMKNEKGELLRESNTNFVEWSDGSFSLFVGDRFFECQVRNDETYVFEDSLDEIKPLHAVVSKYIQARAVNYIPNRGSASCKANQLRQKTKLTSIDEAQENERNINHTLESRKESDILRRKQRNAMSNKGLTRNFLEESEDEQYEETFRMQKRR